MIDEADCPIEGKKPDAVWCGDRFGVIIEAKSRLTPRNDADCVSPDSLLESWRKAWEAVEQADEFIRDPRTAEWLRTKTSRAPSVWVLAILTDEAGVAERIAFRHVTARWNLLAGTRLAGLGLISFRGLEGALEAMSADEFGRSIEEGWIASANSGIEEPPEEPDARGSRPKHLERALKQLTALVSSDAKDGGSDE